MTTHDGPIWFGGTPEGRGRQQKALFFQTDADQGDQQGAFDGALMLNAPQNQKMRDARAGMGTCSKVGAAIRAALGDYLYCVRDRYQTGRLNGLLVSIKSCDPTLASVKTLRGGIETAAGGVLLQQYAFQPGRRIGANVRRPYVVDVGAGRLSLLQFTPAIDHVFPKGTKMAGLQLLLLRVDLDTFATAMTVSPVVVFTTADLQPMDVVLEAPMPEGVGHLFGLLFSGFCDLERDVLRWRNRRENVLGFFGDPL